VPRRRRKGRRAARRGAANRGGRRRAPRRTGAAKRAKRKPRRPRLELLAAAAPRFALRSSVGLGAVNDPADVLATKQRLVELGFEWLVVDSTTHDETIRAIRLFQAIKSGHQRVAHPANDGRIDPGGDTYLWLQAANAPRWMPMPAGSALAGFRNVERSDTYDQHDWGTDWLAATVTAAGAAYRDAYLTRRPGAALLTINDASLPRGGETPDHAGHQTGLACDCRLPRTDGTAPGGTTFRHALFDREATRAMLQALRAQKLVARVFFNDPELIREGLCMPVSGHDDHIHFEIRPPARSGAEL